MNLEQLMKECAEVLEQITGLRVFDHPPEDLAPPAGYLSYPESIDYDQTYGRGMDKIVGLPLVLVSGVVTTRAARNAAATWSAGAGEGSVKALMEAHRWFHCDDLTVRTVRFDVEEIAGIPYLATIFTADAVGTGGS